ncbi:phenylacetate--CoA ligase [Rhodococcus opacus]|uniref:Phenylacetate-coenzyme A ligase n=1 Tax=Rhodococcus opacus TaxID=37919 RepID=A0AAX3YT21_RHOOP|nr:phenylacetate--CoA ligase PaaK [Rhodococcus opacus]MCZ4590198.1 phenylacetate--CoA ligase [Rhodococcus opacus]WLF52303.1 phenylacetate--CoA ligase PaaK [Rhodococcus opacus]
MTTTARVSSRLNLQGAEPDPTEALDIESLQVLQLRRLQWTLRHAYANVPFYTRRFNELGVVPEDCRSLSDLVHFPLTTKQDLRDNYPFGMFAVPPERIARIHASSGTTGEPTVVGYTEEDLDTWAGLVARSIRAAGGRPGHKVHISYGYGLFTGGLGAHYGAERLGCTVIPASGGMTARQVKIIADFRPDVIMATPSYMLTLIDEFERQGHDPRASSLKIGIFGAEPWSEAMRQEIQERMGIEALDTYGLSEVIGPGVAQECLETKDGPHIWEDHFIPEVIDPVTTAALTDGARGELVFTSLTKQAFPIIRYRTRDLSALLPGTARPSYHRIARVTGRSDDMIVLRGVNLFPSQIEEAILRSNHLSPHYQLVRKKDGRMDTLTVRVEGRGITSAEARTHVASSLQDDIKNSIGVTVDVDVLGEHSLTRSEGKIQRVIDVRSK